MGAFPLRGHGDPARYRLQPTPQRITCTPSSETASIVIPARSISLARADYRHVTHVPARYNPLVGAGWSSHPALSIHEGHAAASTITQPPTAGTTAGGTAGAAGLQTTKVPVMEGADVLTTATQLRGSPHGWITWAIPSSMSDLRRRGTALLPQGTTCSRTPIHVT